MKCSNLWRVLVALLALVTGQNVFAGASDGFVSGLVNVQQWAQFARLSNELGDSIYPGERLTITLSGTADINWNNRWEEECFIGICKRKEWIEHNWKSPADWLVVYQLIDDNNSVVAEFGSGSGRADFLVPVDDVSTFNRRMRLYAKFAAGTPDIDSLRSQGQFVARVQVSSVERARALSRYLGETKPSPTAAMMKKVWVNDVFFVEQNRSEIAKWLVQHAQNFFPATSNAKEHRELLEYAGEIDPAGFTVGSALASMYLAQGNANAAEAELVKVIKQLQQSAKADDPTTQLALGVAYLRLASTMELNRGYSDRSDLADIGAQYSAALEIATGQHAPMLAVDALFGRARATRALNTPGGLKAAENDFRSARDQSPVRIAGMPLSLAVGGQEILAAKHPDKTLVSWRSMSGQSPVTITVQAGDSPLAPLAVTEKGRVLASTKSAVGWINLADANPGFDAVTSVVGTVFGGSTNGSTSLFWLTPENKTPSLFLLRDDGTPRAILLDGKVPMIGLMASAADRYLLVAAPPNPPTAVLPPMVAVELRSIGTASDPVIRRVQVPPLLQGGPYRLSADGKRFGVLLDEFSPQGIKRKLVVWDAAADSPAIEMNVPSPWAQPNAAPGPGVPGRPQVPPDSVIAFDFSPDGLLVVVTGDGRLFTVTVGVNATLQPLLVPPEATPSNAPRPFGLATASNDLVVVSGDDDKGRYQQFIQWSTKQVTLVREGPPTSVFVGPVGFWRDAQGRIGSVQVMPAALDIQSINTTDGSVIAQDIVSPGEFGELRLLPGGRFACMAGSGLKVRDLVGHSEATLVQPGSNAANGEIALCIPSREKDSWTLVRHRQGAVTRGTKYVGTVAAGGEMTLTVPDDWVQLEKEAAGRMGWNYVEPAFALQHMRTPLGSASPERDGWMLAISYPNAATAEAMKTPAAVKWVSVPYALIQDPNWQVRRVRLPLGATALRILPSPVDKVVYAWNGKVLWKTIAADVDGTPLMDLPLFGLPPPAPGAMPPNWNFIQVNSAATRLVFASMTFDFANGIAETEQKFFDLRDGAVQAIPCSLCAKRSFDARALVSEIPNYGLGQWGSVQVDASLDNMVLYSKDYAIVYNVSRNAIVGALPPRQVISISPGKAQFLSGRSDFSMVSF